jgi:AAA domain
MNVHLEKRKLRLAELFGVSVACVDDIYDIEWLATIATKRPGLLAYTLDDLERMKEPPFVLPEWVPAGLTVVYAKPKAGKTFWVLTLVICYAMGIPFFGQPVVGSGKVLYIAAEGSGKATWRRISRIAASLGVDMTKLRDRLHVVTTGVKVDDPQSVADLLLLNPGKWDMVVVDTLARCMVGDENSTADMNEAVAGLDKIRLDAKATSLILIHHEGWEKARLRGAIALFGALDAQIHVVRKDGLNFVQVEELREAALPDDPIMTFRLDKEIGALVRVPNKLKGVGKLNEREDAMFAILDRLYAEDGEAVDESAWRNAVKAANVIVAKSDKSWGVMWRRAKDHMTEVGTVFIEPDGRLRPRQPADDFPKDDDDDFGVA